MFSKTPKKTRDALVVTIDCVKNKAGDAKILVDLKNIGPEIEFKILAEHALG